MRCRYFATLGFFLLSCFAVLRAEDLDVKSEVARFSQMYFAAMNGVTFSRLYDPTLGMVEFRRRGYGNEFVGAEGWGAVEENGETVVRRPDAPCVYHFKEGRPSSLEINGKRYSFTYEEEPTIHGGLPEMWEGATEDALARHARKWPGRFSPFYLNPNHSAVLFASIVLIAFAVFLYASRKWAIILGFVGIVLSGWIFLKIGARAAFGALFLGMFVMWCLRFRRSGGRWRLWTLGCLGAVLAVFFVLGGAIGRLSVKFEDRGSSWRKEVWSMTPRMMVDAPWGWGETPPGRAYGDWYQPLKSITVTPTLTSDHLTHMVGLSWFGRFAWGFAWFALLAVLFRFSWYGGSPLPLALFLMLAASAMANPILHKTSLWLVPLASLGLVARSCPQRAWRDLKLPLIIAGVLALMLVGGFYFSGLYASRDAKLTIHTDSKSVFVGSSTPAVWVVDDRYTLGWLFAPKELRYFYKSVPNARAMGYTEKIAAVPKRVHRLVIAGKLCRDYIKAWVKGEAPRAEELVFISPGFGLKEVPPRLMTSCRFQMVVGEFAARYVDVYGELEPSDNVALAPGAEVYIPGWMSLAIAP